jgi:hypothetical protein
MAMLVIAWHGHSQEKPMVTLEMRDASLKEIIKQLEQATTYSFIYNETVDLNQKKSVKIKNQKLNAALNLIFDQTNIDWKINKKHITLNNKKHETTTQKVTISGYITDAESSEVLIGANVYNATNGSGTASNEFGFFSLTSPAGETELRFSYTGYATEMQKINLSQNKNLNIRLKTNLQLEEVVVIGKEQQESGIKATQMSATDVPLDILKTNPVLLGEADIMKTIQMLPGVQAGTQGSAGVHVRGGGPDENLILLDGIPLYNVDHLLGFFSVFTPEAVKKVTLFKGSFPARFGGRLSSVIDVRTNDGDMYNYHGTFSVGLLSSKLQMEGPIWKGRTSFNISARRSYLDLIAMPFFKEDKGILYFYDFNAKINHKFSDKDRLFISLYNGRDKFGTEFHDDSESYKTKDKGHLNWGNTLVAARWNHIFSPKLFSNATVAFTNYLFNIKTDSYTAYPKENMDNSMHATYNSGIKDYSFKVDFEYYPSPKHHVKFGTNYLYHNFKPEVETLKVKDNENGEVSDSTYSNLSNSHIYANEISVYAEDDFNITSRLSLNTGLHFSLFNVRNTTYTSIQPRLSARYQLSDDIALKASYTKMNQYIHLLSSFNITLPFDLWVPATDRIKPMRSHQYSLGAYYTGLKGWEFSAETYYKDMRNIIEYKDGATFLGTSHNWEEKVEMGRGRSYGMELMAQKTLGNTTGWIAYTLAKSERKFDKKGINMGAWFPYKYDRRHHINVAVNHKLSERIDISASWEFYTGGVFTVSEEQTSIIIPSYAPPQDDYIFYYHNYSFWKGKDSYIGPSVQTDDYIKNRNNYRLPASHCLNLGINFRKKKKHGEQIWNFGIYNAYNAMNPHFIYKTTSSENDGNYGGYAEKKPILKKLTIFPFIPSFTYTYKF